MQKNGRSKLKEFCDCEDYYCSYDCTTDPQDEQRWRAVVYVTRNGKNVAQASCKDFFRNKAAAMDNAAEAVLIKLKTDTEKRQISTRAERTSLPSVAKTMGEGSIDFGAGEWKEIRACRSKSPPRGCGTSNRSRSPVPRPRGGDLLPYKTAEDRDQSQNNQLAIWDSSSNLPQLGLDTNTLHTESSILPHVLIYTNIYIIDLENRPFWNREKLRNALYVGFISSTHGAVEKYYDWQPLNSPHLLQESLRLNNKLLYKAEGGVKELVDHFMSAFVVYIVDYVALFRLPTVVHIVSGDNSGWCTRLCLAQHAKWKGVENLISIENKI